MFSSGFEDRWNVISETKLIERLDDVIACNGFLGFLFRDVVRLRADKGNKFNAAFNENVTGFL